MLSPAAPVLPVQVTLPPPPLPPSCADTNDVLAGIGSVTFTPVAAALPMLCTVTVYVRLLPGPTGIPESALEMTRAGTGADESARAHAPRPWVPAAISRGV